MIQLTLAKEEHIPAVMRLLNDAKAFLKAQGIDQWQNGYPNEESIAADIAAESGYLLTEGGMTVGYLYLGFDGEPTYQTIKGSWKQDGSYAVIHRLTISGTFRGQGLASAAFKLAERQAKERGVGSIRVDTGEANQRMQRVIKRNGYEYCGVVRVSDGERLAYEKLL